MKNFLQDNRSIDKRRESSILAVADALAEHAVVFSQYRGRRGHPVGISGAFFEELVARTGSEEAAYAALGTQPRRRVVAADVRDALVAGFEADTEREEIGTVIDAGDGIAHVEGLRRAERR